MSTTTVFNPLAHPIVLAQPRRLTDIVSWQPHIPFAFLCVELLQPRTVVELGTHKGDSYCAFCQAIDVLGLAAAATAVDTWEGDPHTGAYGPEVLAELRAHHDPLYGRFSRLLQSTFDDAVDSFPDGSIDLLHVDGYHTYDAVRHDLETWLPKLSERGVVLLHDTHVRDDDFGVWRLWEELEDRHHPSFAFAHGHGLGVVAPGGDPDARVASFLGEARREPAVGELFASLGTAVTLTGRVTGLEARLAGRDADVESLVDAHRRLERLRDEAQAAFATETEARVRLEEELTGVHDQLTELRNRLSAAEARHEDERSRSEAQLAEAEAQLAEAEAQLADAEARLVETETRRVAAEQHLAAVFATKTWRYARWPRRIMAATRRRPPPPAPASQAIAAAPIATTQAQPVEDPRPALDAVDLARQKTRPLRLVLDANEPTRLNLIVPTVSFDYFFAGYVGKFSLARQLAGLGHRVRIVIVDHCDYDPAMWQPQLDRYGLGDVLQRVELAYTFDRRQQLAVNPDDRFIATTWWTAHIAEHAARSLGGRRFVYLIQEYEPMTFPMGSFAALAEQTYSFPHDALFSTELLRDYFRRNAIGVYAEGVAEGDARSISFQNPIVDVGEVTSAELRRRRPSRLLFYARHEGHAARNMFELGGLALSAAAREGLLDGWELTGIGTVGPSSTLELGSGARLRLLPRVTPDEYVEILRAHDIGLSLMYTPHPSLPPIEMAAAGMVVVTNTFANKTAEALKAISTNFVVSPPTLDGIIDALRRAIGRSGDVEARARGAHVRWSRRWEDSFTDDVLAALQRFVAD